MILGVEYYMVTTIEEKKHVAGSRLIKLREEWRGSRGGQYYYVKEGYILRRISEYAISSREIDRSSRGSTIEYDVPAEKLYGKIIYIFSFTNRGRLYVRKCGVEAFLNPKYPGIPNYDLTQDVSPDEFFELSFEVKDEELVSILEDFKKYYITMINDLNDYLKRVGFVIIFMRHAERTLHLLRNPYAGIFECMVLQSDNARLKCLEKPLAWVYQLWVMKLICDALGIQEFVRRSYEEDVIGKPLWWIEQGKPYPAFIARSGLEYFTFWFEFQPHEMAHLIGMFSGERVYVRPDIVVVRGMYDSAEGLIKSGKRIDLIVECKNTNFTYWERDIYSQIPAYINTYNPKAFILASLKSIPNNTKHLLISKGIITVDELRPNNNTGIEEFKKFVKKALLP